MEARYALSPLTSKVTVTLWDGHVTIVDCGAAVCGWCFSSDVHYSAWDILKGIVLPLFALPHVATNPHAGTSLSWDTKEFLKNAHSAMFLHVYLYFNLKV